MFKKSITTSFCILLFSITYAQRSMPDAVNENIKARIDNGINVGIVVGIIDLKGAHFHSYGVKSLKSNEAVNEHSVFEIGSITKTFTGILLAEMVITGEVNLADPLQKYLPKGITAPTKDDAYIKLVHLSNHTSALPRLPTNLFPINPANPYADYSEKQLFDFLNDYKLPRDIESDYEYSNYATGLLGHILATRRGVSYEQLMVDVIAKPLNLQSTSVTLTPEMKKNLAIGYAGEMPMENWDFMALAGAGAIRSTAADMATYVRANMGLVKSSLYPAMQLSHQNSRKEGAEPKVGLGWHIMDAGNHEIIWHNGGTGGYRTFIGFSKGANKGVVVLSNSIASIDDIGIHLLNPAVPLKVIEKPIIVVNELLDQYVGKYEIAPGFVLAITNEEGQLHAQATGQPKFPIFAKTQTTFYYKVVEAQLTFNRNKDGEVESVTLNQGGQNIVGKRK